MKGKILKSKSKSYLIAKIIVFIIFAIYAFTLLYALAWAFITSFKDQFEYMKDKNGLPDVWHFDNYLTAIKSVSVNDHGMLAMLINSLWYAGGGAVLGTLVSSMVAYVVAKYRFPGRNVLYTVALLTMMLPIVGASRLNTRYIRRWESLIHLLCYCRLRADSVSISWYCIPILKVCHGLTPKRDF